jgi:NADPH:quinone reductase-like Zn-dependent oxidoreductase
VFDPDMLLKGTNNETLTRVCRSVAPEAMIVATADDGAHEQRLRAAGADLVVAPHTLVAEELASVIGQVLGGRAAAAAATLRGRNAFERGMATTLKQVA